jgi:ABC-type uncharacterized transport system fused permease/ATPase subunit
LRRIFFPAQAVRVRGKKCCGLQSALHALFRTPKRPKPAVGSGVSYGHQEPIKHCQRRLQNKSPFEANHTRPTVAISCEVNLTVQQSGAERPVRGHRFLSISKGFWEGRTSRRAWLHTSAVLVFLLLNLGAALAVNRWNKFFFDALEKKDTTDAVFGIGLVLVLALFSAASSVGLLHSRMRLQLRWRQWFVRSLMDRWIANRHFYQLTIIQTEADNPEARITEDARLAIELLVDFTLGVLNASLVAISFISILWVVGGALDIGGYSIPGYMVIACIV